MKTLRVTVVLDFEVAAETDRDEFHDQLRATLAAINFADHAPSDDGHGANMFMLKAIRDIDIEEPGD